MIQLGRELAWKLFSSCRYNIVCFRSGGNRNSEIGFGRRGKESCVSLLCWRTIMYELPPPNTTTTMKTKWSSIGSNGREKEAWKPKAVLFRGNPSFSTWHNCPKGSNNYREQRELLGQTCPSEPVEIFAGVLYLAAFLTAGSLFSPQFWESASAKRIHVKSWSNNAFAIQACARRASHSASQCGESFQKVPFATMHSTLSSNQPARQAYLQRLLLGSQLNSIISINRSY